MNKHVDSTIHFTAIIPRSIEPKRDPKCSSQLAGFPSILLLRHVQRTESGDALKVVAAIYEPDVNTFVEAEERRELSYQNRGGGRYTIRVILKKANGSIEALKYNGDRIVAIAAGKDFDFAMIQIGLMGIAPDEPVSFVERCK